MPSLNLCQFMGNVGSIESRFMANGDPVVNLSLAVNESWKDSASGEKKERVEWVRGVIFGKLAQIAGEYVVKGAPLYISGRMQTKKYQGKDGTEKLSVEIIVDRLQMLGSKSDNAARDDDAKPAPKTMAKPAAAGGSFTDLDSDIPFDRLARGIGGHSI